MEIDRGAIAQGAAIVLLGYLLWMGIPTAVGNTLGPGAVPAVIPALNVAVLLVPVLAGFRAARVAENGKPLNAVIGALAGVTVILTGIYMLIGGPVPVGSYLKWVVGGGMLAWLGAIIEPYVSRKSL